MKDSLSAALVWVYGTLVLSGGLAGYLLAGSVVSLVTALMANMLLLQAGYLIWQGRRYGWYIATGTSGLLTVAFAFRYSKSGLLLPSGALAILGLFTATYLLITYLKRLQSSIE